jgi:hypothetical protein
VRVPILLTGGFRSAVAMASALEASGVSLIGLARPLCTDPEGPKRLLREGGELDRPELRVRLGSGLLGPGSPFRIVKALNGFGAISWYYQQLRSLGGTGLLSPSLGVLTALRRERADQAAWLRSSRSS